MSLALPRRTAAPPLPRRDGILLAGGLALVVAALSLAPLAQLVGTALAPAGSWSLDSVIAQFESRTAARAAWNSLESATLSALGALALGTSFALAVSVTDIRGRRALAFIFVFSLMVAPQVMALAYLSLAGPASPVLTLLGLAPAPGTPNPLLGRGGVILVMALHHAPLVAVTIWAGLRYVPRSVIEAAQIDGASPRQVVTKVLLPALRPSIIGGGLLAFVAGVGNFGIPALMGLPVNYVTLPTLIYRRLSSFGPSVLSDMAALALIVALIAGAGTVAGAILLRRQRGKVEIEQKLQPFALLDPRRLWLEALLWTLLALKVGLPFLALIGDSLRPALGMPLTLATLTFDKFAEVLTRQDATIRAFRNSLLLAGAAAAILFVLSVLFAYALERRFRRLRPAIEVLIEAPYALPGVVLAIACILIFLRPLPVIGVSLYGTVFVILFAYLARFLAPAIKPTLAAMSQIEAHHEEAARLDGASEWQILRLVVAPILAPAAGAGALLAFLIAFNELTVSALLWSAGAETLGVVLFSLKEAGLAGEAAAVAISASAIVLGLMLLLDRMARALPEDVIPWRV